MEKTEPQSNHRKKIVLRAVALAGLLAGVLDAVGAIINFLINGGKDPIRIFNFIASGALGTSALTGGLLIAFAGLLFHLVIATLWAFLYFYAYPRIKWLSWNWVVSGLGYGIVVWVGMNLIVVPLSRAPHLPLSIRGVMVGMFILMVCVGLPVAYLAKRHYK